MIVKKRYPAWILKLNQLVSLLVSLLIVVVFAGCERTPHKLTDRDIQLMSVTKISSAWIDLPDGSQFSLESPQFGEMNELLKSLAPIESVDAGELSGCQYQLNYQSGMDPTSIRVSIDGEKLIFSIGGFVYAGGKSKTFLDAIARLQGDSAG